VVTPGSVRRLIEWCLSASKELIEVNWTGTPLSIVDPDGQAREDAGTWNG
jgi:hypothetical protein